MSPRMRIRFPLLVLLGFVTIVLAASPSLASVIDLTTSGASVTDGQGVIWSEGGGTGGGSGLFNSFLRLQRDSVENAFNTDYTPVPLDGLSGSFTHSLRFSLLKTVTVSDVAYYSFRLDANESGSDEPLSVDAVQIFSASDSTYADHSTLASAGTLLYEMSPDQEVHLSTALHPGSGDPDITVLIPKSYFSELSGPFLYLYCILGDSFDEGMHASDGFEEWAALLGSDEAPSVTAPLAVNGEEGGLLTFGVSASDPDGDPISSLTMDLGGFPVENDADFVTSGDNTSGTFTWNMQSGDSGTYYVTFTATSNDLSDYATTQIHVGLAGTNITGVFTWTPQEGQEGDYDVVFTATDEGGTTTATTTITVATPIILTPRPSAPLAPRLPGGLAPQAPQAPQKGPIIDAPRSATTQPGSAVSVTVTASTDTSPTPSASLSAKVVPSVRLSARAVQTTTLSADFSNLPEGHDATFEVDHQPIITGDNAVTLAPGETLSLIRAASDPDGEALDSFTADLTGLPLGNPGSFAVTGPNTLLTGTVTWTPGAADVGTYVVDFTAYNQLVGLGSTTITVTEPLEARLFVIEPVKINIGSNRPENCVYIEPVDASFAVTDIDIATVKMISAGTGSVSEIPAISDRPVLIGDRDNNRVSDLGACFTKANLRALFGNLSGNQNLITIRVEGQLVTGAFFSGNVDVQVIANGPNVGSATIAPNPLNPQAKLSLMLGKPGPLRVTLYDAQGRFVRELARETNAAAGPREITVDGLDAKGKPLASGVYFFRVESADGMHNGRFAIVR
jgi:flagellar hook capping protein FlgD